MTMISAVEQFDFFHHVYLFTETLDGHRRANSVHDSVDGTRLIQCLRPTHRRHLATVCGPKGAELYDGTNCKSHWKNRINTRGIQYRSLT